MDKIDSQKLTEKLLGDAENAIKIHSKNFVEGINKDPRAKQEIFHMLAALVGEKDTSRAVGTKNVTAFMNQAKERAKNIPGKLKDNLNALLTSIYNGLLETNTLADLEGLQNETKKKIHKTGEDDFDFLDDDEEQLLFFDDED